MLRGLVGWGCSFGGVLLQWWGLTGWVGGFKDPVGVFCVGDGLAGPFDEEVAVRFFEEGGAGEGVHV